MKRKNDDAKLEMLMHLQMEKPLVKPKQVKLEANNNPKKSKARTSSIDTRNVSNH